MGGGYAKIGDGQQAAARQNGEAGGIGDEEDHEQASTPRTKNEEIARKNQSAAAASSSASASKGPASASTRGGNWGSGGGPGAGNQKSSKYALEKIRWVDQHSAEPLAETHYSEKLHYSVMYS